MQRNIPSTHRNRVKPMGLIAFNVQMRTPRAREASLLWGLTCQARISTVSSCTAGYKLTMPPHASKLQSLYRRGTHKLMKGFTASRGRASYRHAAGRPEDARHMPASPGRLFPRSAPGVTLSNHAGCGAQLPLFPAHPRAPRAGPGRPPAALTTASRRPRAPLPGAPTAAPPR